jgi:hypothetical protein
LILSQAQLRKALERLQARDWQAAHEIVQQDEESALACWAHGIVHILEGDLPNARYWYREAGRAFPGEISVETETEALKRALVELRP